MINLKSKFNSEIVDGDAYRGYPLMRVKGPFVARYLDRIIAVMESSLAAHPRTLAVRFDLRLPQHARVWTEHRLMDRFMASLKEKIKWARYRAARAAKDGRVHQSEVHYVWAREVGQRGRPHYHVVLFLNRDAFSALGKYEAGRDNLYCRIMEAWASTLKLLVEDAVGLVHIPRNAVFRVDASCEVSKDAFFKRASYLTKSATKVQESRHSFGGSRRRRMPRR